MYHEKSIFCASQPAQQHSFFIIICGLNKSLQHLCWSSSPLIKLRINDKTLRDKQLNLPCTVNVLWPGYDSFVLLCWNQRDNLRISEFERGCVRLIASCGGALPLLVKTLSESMGACPEMGLSFRSVFFYINRLDPTSSLTSWACIVTISATAIISTRVILKIVEVIWKMTQEVNWNCAPTLQGTAINMVLWGLRCKTSGNRLPRGALSPFMDGGLFSEKKLPKNVISEGRPTQKYQTLKIKI